jgi:hypothetical protein
MTFFRRVALTVVAAIGGVSLVPAVALAHEFNAKLSSITAEGTNHVFTAGEAIIKCAKAKFQYSGGIGKFAKISIVPSYETCKVGTQNATVTVEKAKFEFTVSKEIKSNEFSLTSAIVGEAGAKLKVAAMIEEESCEVSFPTQAIAGEASKFVNNVEKTGGEVKTKLEKVEYKTNNKCGTLISKEGKNGKYEGSAAETGLIIE